MSPVRRVEEDGVNEFHRFIDIQGASAGQCVSEDRLATTHRLTTLRHHQMHRRLAIREGCERRSMQFRSA